MYLKEKWANFYLETSWNNPFIVWAIDEQEFSEAKAAFVAKEQEAKVGGAGFEDKDEDNEQVEEEESACKNQF